MSKMVEMVKGLDCVSQVKGWNDRHYVNLEGFSKGHAGDRNQKIWIKGDVLKIEKSKGSFSSEFSESLSRLINALENAGAERKGYGDNIESTWTI